MFIKKNELEIGQVLTEMMRNGEIQRHELFITSKIGFFAIIDKIAPKDQGYEKTRLAIQASLDKLGSNVGCNF
jgi:diketogulonate reductase-like aldo/keto reductase